MARLYYQYPFGLNADDLTAIPQGAAMDNSVSYYAGWTDPYEYNLLTNPAALPIPRGQMNQLFLDITNNIQQYQQSGVPIFISSSDNGGSSFPYAAGAFAQLGGLIYQSLVGSNTTTPPSSSWRLVDNSSGALVINNAVFDAGVTVNGQPVYYDSGSSTYKLAVANGSSAQYLVGIADITNDRVYVAGVYGGYSGLTIGSTYYLDHATAGAYGTSISAVAIGIAISATQIALNISQNAITDTGAGAAQSVRLPNGLIFQWGETGSIASGALETINLPIPFPSANYTFQVTPNVVGTSTSGQSGSGNILSGSQATVSNTGPVSVEYYWYATGF